MRLFWGVWLALLVALPLRPFQASASSKGGASGPEKLVFTSPARYTIPIPRILPLALPDGRLLLTVGSLLKMAQPDGRIIWTYSADDIITAQPAFRPDRDELGIITSVLEFIRLDARTGRELTNDHVSGTGDRYTDVKPFGSGYLVLNDGTFARERFHDAKIPDELDYFSETGEKQRMPFPAGAKLLVDGDRLYAVTYGEKSVTLQRIVIR